MPTRVFSANISLDKYFSSPGMKILEKFSTARFCATSPLYPAPAKLPAVAAAPVKKADALFAADETTPAADDASPAVYLSSPAAGVASPAIYLSSPTVYLPSPAVGEASPAVYLPSPTIYLPSPAIYFPSPAVSLPSPTAGDDPFFVEKPRFMPKNALLTPF